MPQPPSPERPQPTAQATSATVDQSPLADLCFIEHTNDMEQWEAELEYLWVFAQIVGRRQEVEPQDALRAIADAFHLDASAFEIHPVAPPEDFIVKLPDHGALLEARQGDRTVTTPGFSMILRPWSRLAHAEHGALYHNVTPKCHRAV